MTDSDIIYKLEEGIATLIINRPRKLNSFNQEMTEQMLSIGEEVARDTRVRVLVITGTGRSFCSGGDVKRIEQDIARLNSPRSTFADISRLPILIHAMDKPVIAAVNGLCAGGGLDIACACDIRIASDKARFSSIVVRRGIMPTMGATYFLPRLIGMDKALEFIWTGDMIDANEAERIGLVTRVVPHEELEAATTELASRLVKGPPLAIAKAKQTVYRGLAKSFESAMVDVRRESRILGLSEDHREGMQAFVEKREPTFKGR